MKAFQNFTRQRIQEFWVVMVSLLKRFSSILSIWRIGPFLKQFSHSVLVWRGRRIQVVMVSTSERFRPIISIRRFGLPIIFQWEQPKQFEWSWYLFCNDSNQFYLSRGLPIGIHLGAIQTNYIYLQVQFLKQSSYNLLMGRFQRI